MNLYLIAMETEAKDIVENYRLIFDVPFKLYENKNNLVAITGIGKVNASFVTSYLVGKYSISKLINLGFVGAVGNFKVKDVVLVKEALYHDFDLTMFGYEKGQVPNLPQKFLPNIDLINKLKYDNAATLYSGDYFMLNKIEDNYIADMEGTAIFHVGFLMDLPVLSVKIVSDIIGSNDHIEEYSDFELIGSSLLLEVFKEIKGII